MLFDLDETEELQEEKTKEPNKEENIPLKARRLNLGNTLTIESPIFTIYNSPEMDAFAGKDLMSSEVINKLVRCTVDNMISVCHCLTVPRRPTKHEIVEMAKKLCHKFPALVDKYSNTFSKSLFSLPLTCIYINHLFMSSQILQDAKTFECKNSKYIKVVYI